MMKYIVTMLGVALAVSCLMAGDVENTVKWNVPWGDAFRDQVIVTLDAMEVRFTTTVIREVSPTTITSVDPEYIGRFLVISNAAGTGTSAVYIAEEATTNGWAQIK